MPIFFEPNIKSNLYLNGEESRHAVKVLRLSARDLIDVVDGNGGFYKAEIIKPHEKKCELSILEEIQNFGKKDFCIHLAIAPTKNLDRMEWMVEKSVEIGIDEISFLQTRYSERKEIKIARLEKIAISAMKQSQKAMLPKLNEMQKLANFLTQIQSQTTTQKFIAHLEEGERKSLAQIANKNANYCVLIGPEGDFSPEEIKKAIQNDFQAVTLGKSRLRTETAGLYACTVLNFINENYQ